MIISVASGKGGTGKTLVATSLALSLKGKQKVQLLDCDVEEPNDHIFVKPVITESEAVCIPIPEIDENKCTYCGKCTEVCAYHAIAVFTRHLLVFPNLCHGCGACMHLCPEKAISEKEREIGLVERGHANGVDFAHGKLSVGEAMPTPVIRKVKELVNHEGITIIDVSPGTSCPVVESIKGSDFCLLVTEPTPFGLNDLTLAVETVNELKVPCGVVLNRAGIGDSRVEEYCQREDIPMPLTIPLDMEIARLYSRGITLVEGMPQWKESFVRLFEQVQEIVSERSRCLKR
ncbi:MAG: (4Fe-4S)-binding protein [Chloroflexi bacterium RBG_16_50_9]|nr:MAG: (4Fe-4S)-binding protein [Chloroflexi bacterium RBG_16_50_9]